MDLMIVVAIKLFSVVQDLVRGAFSISGALD